MAVAIWDHSPNNDELLQHRLANGWKPTASETKTGQVIEGYASYLLTPKRSNPSNRSTN